MLLIHFFEGNGPVRLQVARAFLDSASREDELLVSCLTMGEFLAGARLHPEEDTAQLLRNKVKEMRFSLLPFDERAIEIFAELRAVHRVKAPDAINLACAGSAGIDLFLTEDKQLHRMHVPGIKFIAGLDAIL